MLTKGKRDSVPMKFFLEDLVDVGVGAAFLGTGGGGDPYMGRLMAEHAIREFGMPEVISVDDLSDDDAVFTAAMVGAPTVMMEKGMSGADIDMSINRLAEVIGKRPTAIAPIEIGGINSMLPIVAAARLGLPLVDCDGMGRAFPEIQMVTFNVYGVSATPAVIVNEHLETVVIETNSAKRAEELIRVSAIQMGLSVPFSGYPMTGRQIKDFSVKGTLSMALNIGRAIREGRSSGRPIDALLSYLRSSPYYSHCKVLFDGKITDIRREISKGFNMGEVVITGLDDQRDQVNIQFQNEYLVAKRNDKILTIVPDLIAIVDRETAVPITVEALKFGQRVKVVGISAAPIMRTPESLSVFGPRGFGIDEDFIKIEDIHRGI